MPDQVKRHGWEVINCPTRKQVHVRPFADAIEHETYPGCWCQPKRNAGPAKWTCYVHHSADGRELLEGEGARPATRH